MNAPSPPTLTVPVPVRITSLFSSGKELVDTLVGKYEIPWAQFSAFVLTFAPPIVILYMFSQRYIEGGLSFGRMDG